MAYPDNEVVDYNYFELFARKRQFGMDKSDVFLATMGDYQRKELYHELADVFDKFTSYWVNNGKNKTLAINNFRIKLGIGAMDINKLSVPPHDYIPVNIILALEAEVSMVAGEPVRKDKVKLSDINTKFDLSKKITNLYKVKLVSKEDYKVVKHVKFAAYSEVNILSDLLPKYIRDKEVNKTIKDFDIDIAFVNTYSYDLGIGLFPY